MPNSTILKTLTLSDGTYNNTLPLEDTTARSSISTLQTTVGGKADKVSSPTNGDFAALDANGNLTDSGHKHSDYQATLISGTNIKTINSQSILGSGNITIQGGGGGGSTTLAGLDDTNISNPSGKQLLTYDSSTSKWVNEDPPKEIPAQSGNSGYFLTTDGSTLSWASTKELPSQTNNSGKFLTTNGSAVSWASVPDEIPSQSGNNGKFLTTNGSTLSWATVSGGSGDIDFHHSVGTITSNTLPVAFADGERTSVYASTTSDLDLDLEIENSTDNYIWVKNTGSADIDITISSVTYMGDNMASSTYIPEDGISAPAGCVCEIGIIGNSTGVFITSRNDLKL